MFSPAEKTPHTPCSSWVASLRRAHRGRVQRGRVQRRGAQLRSRALLGLSAVAGLMMGYALAQTLTSPAAVTVEAVTASSVSVHLPALPGDATSLTLQRSTISNSPVMAPLSADRVLWLEADSIGGVSNGEAVSQWGSLGSSYLAFQNTSSSQPVLVKDALQGHAVVRFDGGDDFLRLSSGLRDFSQGLSAFVVAKPQSTNSYARFFEFGNGPSADNMMLAHGASPSDLYYDVRYTSWQDAYGVGSGIVNGQYQLLGVVQQGGAPSSKTTTSFFRNGASLGNGRTFVPRILTRTSNFIGQSNWSDGPFHGDIAEIILYNTALGEDERQSVESYLAAKYGLSVPSTSGATWTTIATGQSGNALYEDTAVAANTTYAYRCVAVSATDSATGSATQVTTPPLAPATPLHPTISDVGATTLVVSAPALPARATNLVLQQKLTADPDSSYVTLAQNLGATYQVTGLSASTAYTFRVLAVGEGGSSASNGASVTTEALDAPAIPLAPSIQSVSASSLDLQMPALPAGASSFSLQRATDPSVTTPSAPPASGLTVWLKADSIAGPNNALVPSWNDSSGHGNHATTSDPSNRPTWIANGFNGQPVVRMDGNDDFFRLPTQATVRTALVVTRHHTGSQDYSPIFGSSQYLFHGGPGSYLFWWDYTSIPVKLGQAYQDGLAFDALALQKPTEFHILSFVPTAPVTVNSLSNQDGIGGRAWNGDFAEVLLYNRVLSISERQEAEGYLAAKYGLDTPPSNLTWSTLDTGLSAQQTYSDLTVAASTRYFYRAVAVGTGGSTPGQIVSTQTKPPAPSAPAAPTFSQVGATQLLVSAPSLPAGATNLTLQQKLSSESDSSYQTLSNAQQSTYRVTGLSAQTAYTFRFVAVNAGGGTSGSAASVTTQAADAPAAPAAPILTSATSSSLQLKLPVLPSGASTLTLQRALAPALSAPPSNGLQLWLQGDTIAGSNNAPVSQWGDSSGQGYLATQSTSASQPALVTGALNGHAVVHFDGSDDFLSLSSGFSDFSQGLSAFVVSKPLSTNSYARFFELGNGPSADNILFSLGGSSSEFYYDVRYGGSGYAYGVGSGIVNGQYQVLDLVQQGGVPYSQGISSFFRDGASLGNGTTYVPRILNRTSNFLGKSNWGGGDGQFNGDIAEVLVYNQALGEDQRQSVEAYLAAKYSLGTFATPDDLSWTTVATGQSGEATYTDSGLDPQTRYLYRCVAVGTSGSTPGAAASAQTKPPAPAAPEVPTFSQVGATRLRIVAPSWPAHATNLVLQQKLGSEADSAYVTLTPMLNSSYQVTSLSASTAYSFRCLAVGEGGTTVGAAATVTTQSVDAPAAPLAPTLQNALPTSLQLKLPALPTGASTLSLQRATGPTTAPTAPPSSGLTVWLKADSIAGPNNAAVATWNDSSGHGNDATTLDVSNRPIWIANGLNGRPVVRMDGNDDFFRLPTQATVRTAIVVTRHHTGSQDYTPILGSAQYFFHGGSSTALFSWDYTSDAVKLGRAYLDGRSLDAIALQKPTEFHILSLVPTGPVTVNSLSTQEGAGGRAWNGDFAEVLLYNRTLSDAEREQAEAYLAGKYGLAGALEDWNWTTVAMGLGANAAYTDTGLSYNTQYLYRAVAVNAVGSTSGPPLAAKTLVQPPAPSAPGAPTFSDARTTSVLVTAPALPLNAVSFTLQQKLAGQADSAYVNVATGLAPASDTLAEGLSASTLYTFRYVAVGYDNSTPGTSADLQTPAPAIGGFQWSYDGVSWNSVTPSTVLQVERFSNVGIRAVKTSPNSPWPGGLPGPAWSWQGTQQVGEEVWLTGKNATGSGTDSASASLYNTLSVPIQVLPKAYLYLSTPSDQVTVPALATVTDPVSVTLTALDTDGVPLSNLRVRLRAVNADEELVGLWGSATEAASQLILTTNSSGQLTTTWSGPANAGTVHLQAVPVDGADVPFGSGDSADLTVIP